jgi:hypothetical protein
MEREERITGLVSIVDEVNETIGRSKCDGGNDAALYDIAGSLREIVHVLTYLANMLKYKL